MLKTDINLLTKFCRKLLFSSLILSSPLALAEDFTIERLSLFVSDGANVYENRPLNTAINTLPSNISVDFQTKTDANGDTVWQWNLKNKSKVNYNNLRITGLIDVDLDALGNTFFNEYGSLLSLSAPSGYIAPDKWEISEPGYLKGDLITRASHGSLKNTSVYNDASTTDDSAMALSIDIGNLRAGQEIIAVATLAGNSTIGLTQRDSITSPKTFFNFYAKKGYFDRAYPDMVQGGLLTTGSAIKEGNVWVWGFRGSSQQGNGTKVVSSNKDPAKVNSLTNIIGLTGGAYHLIALDNEGNVYGWGQSGYGETGCKPTKSIYVSTPCKVLKNAVQIGAGEYFSVALDADGKVWTWGHNLYGQLGNSGKKNSQIPIAVDLKGEKARLIGGAYEGAFAVTEEGHVWAWGDNEASGLGFQGSNYGVQKIIRTPTRVPNLDQYADRMTYIAGGNGWGEALLDDGTVIGWGLHAALGQGTTKTNISSPEPVVVMKNVAQLYARYVGSIALTEDGKIYTWGQTGGSAFPMIYGASPTLRTPHANDPVVSVGGGKEHVFYQTESGAIYGVGYNDLHKIDQTKCCASSIDWPGKGVAIGNTR